MESDVPHRPGKLYKAKIPLRKKPAEKKTRKSVARSLA